jgi:N-acetylglucosaminyldiphosphoundecaprenol N-acetyl-beta-D-mannosaminyltransferase
VISILRDLNLYNQSFDNLLTDLQARLSEEQKTFLVTVNPVIYMQTQRDSQYKDIIDHADYITPDGIGIVKARQWLGKPVEERITGFDLMKELLQLANLYGWKVYLLGSKSGVVAKTSAAVRESYPNLDLAGYHHGYFTNDAAIVEEIKGSEPDLIFVAMGCPRQEQWIHENLGKFRKGVFIGVGGSFDVISGMDQRAPQGWIDLHLEWLYRIVMKPRRILLLPKLLSFVFEVLKEVLAFDGVEVKRKVVEKKG